jgi:MFS family permease
MFTHIFDLINLALIPVFIKEFRLTTIQAGILATILILVGMISSVTSGVLTSKLGYKSILVSSLTIMGISSILVSRADSYFVLIADLSILSFASSLFCPPALSIVSESCANCEEDRGKTIGFHVSIVTIGISLGPILLGILMYHFLWRLAYLVLAVPLFLSVFPLVALRLTFSSMERDSKNETEEDRFAKASSFISLGFILTLVALGLRSMGIDGVSTFMTTYLTTEKGLSDSFSSIFYGVGSGLGIIGISLGGILSDKIGEKRGITITWMGGLISLLLFSLSPSIGALLFFYILYGIFSSGSTAPLMSLVARLTSKNRRSLGYMLYFFSTSLMSGFSPLVSAKIIEALGIWYIFPFALIMLAFSILVIQKGL